jgi:hypothetical protein
LGILTFWSRLLECLSTSAGFDAQTLALFGGLDDPRFTGRAGLPALCRVIMEYLPTVWAHPRLSELPHDVALSVLGLMERASRVMNMCLLMTFPKPTVEPKEAKDEGEEKDEDEEEFTPSASSIAAVAPAAATSATSATTTDGANTNAVGTDDAYAAAAADMLSLAGLAGTITNHAAVDKDSKANRPSAPTTTSKRQKQADEDTARRLRDFDARLTYVRRCLPPAEPLNQFNMHSSASVKAGLNRQRIHARSTFEALAVRLRHQCFMAVMSLVETGLHPRYDGGDGDLLEKQRHWRQSRVTEEAVHSEGHSCGRVSYLDLWPVEMLVNSQFITRREFASKVLQSAIAAARVSLKETVKHDQFPQEEKYAADPYSGGRFEDLWTDQKVALALTTWLLTRCRDILRDMQPEAPSATGTETAINGTDVPIKGTAQAGAVAERDPFLTLLSTMTEMSRTTTVTSSVANDVRITHGIKDKRTVKDKGRVLCGLLEAVLLLVTGRLCRSQGHGVGPGTQEAMMLVLTRHAIFAGNDTDTVPGLIAGLSKELLRHCAAATFHASVGTAPAHAAWPKWAQAVMLLLAYTTQPFVPCATSLFLAKKLAPLVAFEAAAAAAAVNHALSNGETAAPESLESGSFESYAELQASTFAHWLSERAESDRRTRLSAGFLLLGGPYCLRNEVAREAVMIAVGYLRWARGHHNRSDRDTDNEGSDESKHSKDKDDDEAETTRAALNLLAQVNTNRNRHPFAPSSHVPIPSCRKSLTICATLIVLCLCRPVFSSINRWSETPAPPYCSSKWAASSY